MAARRGQMLPPSGGGPVEVTREFLEQEEAKKTTTPSGSSPAKGQQLPTPSSLPQQQDKPALNEVTLPSATDPLPEILAGCERVILAATIDFKEAERKAVAAWVGKVGPAVRLVHQTKAYKEIKDARGKPYKSFARWAHERCGISRPHAYRMVSEGPVAEALEPVYSGPLSTRQVDVLAPVLRQHGAKAVRSIWSTAHAAGSTNATQLVVTRDALDLAVQPEDYEPPKTESPASGNGTLSRVQHAARSLDRAALRRAAQEDPEGARQAVEAARRFAAELQGVLAELEGGKSKTEE